MQSSRFLIVGLLVAVTYFTAYSSAIQCYHCHSELDPRCGDPWEEPGNDTGLIVDCDSLGDHNYTFCRKTVQTATMRPDKLTTRIIRSCGFLDEPKLTPNEGDDPADLRCFRRAGTFAVELLYCACHADGCNSANMNGVSNSAISLFLLGLVTYFYHRV